LTGGGSKILENGWQYTNIYYLCTPQKQRVNYFLTLNADQQNRLKKKKLAPAQHQKNYLLA
jgi:hypothetical protein